MPGNMSVRCDHDDEDHNNDVHALVVIIDENESDLLIIVPFSGCPSRWCGDKTYEIFQPQSSRWAQSHAG